MKGRLKYSAAAIVAFVLALALQLSFASRTTKAKQEGECDACLQTAEQQFEQCMQSANSANRGKGNRESRLAAHEQCRSAYKAAKQDCASRFDDCTDTDDNDGDDTGTR